jgi:hypothetical protein
MAKYARGKKSYAISDRSGLRVKYTQLKTTWDGLRVSPEDWEPKQPQLTPAKNVVDATALFNGRPDTDPENAVVYIGYTQDWTVDPRLRPGVGVPAFGGVAQLNFTDFEYGPEASGSAGTGAIGSLAFAVEVTGVSGGGGTGRVGVEALEVNIAEAGVAGTGAVGAEALELSIAEAGVAGTGAVGAETPTVINDKWGSGDWGEGTWGN